MNECPKCDGILNPVHELMDDGIEDLDYQRCRDCGWDSREAALEARVIELEENRPEFIFNDDDIREVTL